MIDPLSATPFLAAITVAKLPCYVLLEFDTDDLGDDEMMRIAGTTLDFHAALKWKEAGNEQRALVLTTLNEMPQS